MEWIFTGGLYPATAAHTYGLVNRLTAPGRARAGAIELAHVIAKNGPLALRASKQIVTASRDWSTEEQFARQQEIYEPVRSSEDAREGATAFKEKRAPKWTGR